MLMWILFAVLVILHHDWWFWDNGYLIFGFLPIGLAYHAGFSIACAVLMFLMVKFAWPTHLEAYEQLPPLPGQRDAH